MVNIETILGAMKKWVFSAEEKMQILCEAEEHGATSACRKYDVATSLFYKWKRQFCEKGIDGLQGPYHRIDPAVRELEKENERLKRSLPARPWSWK